MKNYKYKAFISYRHMRSDKLIAVRLQKMLESYKPPKGIKHTEKWRVFRDETELTSSDDLSSEIKEALEDSEFLIVICSSETQKSKWCLEEINYFKKLHNNTTHNIITLVIEGKAEDIIPRELRTILHTQTDAQGNTVQKEVYVEPLAANISADNILVLMKKLRTEFLRIAAPLLNCGFDDLYNREQRRKFRRITTAIAGVTVFATIFSIYNGVIFLKLNNQSTELEKQRTELEYKENELALANDKYNSVSSELNTKLAELDSVNNELLFKNSTLSALDSKLSDREKEISDLGISLTNMTTRYNQQKAEGEKNLLELNKQRLTAENNIRLAENRSKELRISNAAALVTESQAMYDSGDRMGAIKNALSIRPYANSPDTLLPATYKFLTAITYAYKDGDNPFYFMDNIMLHGRLTTYGDTEKLICSPDNSKILALDSSRVYVWDRKSLKSLYTSKGVILNAEFADENNLILMENNRIYKLEYATGKVVWESKPEQNTNVYMQNYMFISPDRKTAAYYDYWYNVVFINTEDGKEIYKYTPDTGLMNETLSCFADNNRFLYVNTLGDVHILDFSNAVSHELKKFPEEDMGFHSGGASVLGDKIYLLYMNEEEKSIIDTYDMKGQLISSVTADYNMYGNALGYDVNKNFMSEINGKPYMFLDQYSEITVIDCITGKSEKIKGLAYVLDYYIYNGVLYVVDQMGDYSYYMNLSENIQPSTIGNFNRISDAVFIDRSEFVLLSQDKRSILVFTCQYDKGYEKKLDISKLGSAGMTAFSYDGGCTAVMDKENTVHIYSDKLKTMSEIQLSSKPEKIGFIGKKLFALFNDGREVYDAASGKQEISVHSSERALYPKYRINAEQGYLLYTEYAKREQGYNYDFTISVAGNNISRTFSLKDTEYTNAASGYIVIDGCIDLKTDKLALLTYNDEEQKHVLIEYDLNTDTYKKLAEVNEAGKYVYMLNYLEYSNGRLIAGICNRLYIFDSQRNITDNTKLDFYIREIKTIPSSDNIILFGNGGDIYKYSCKEHKIAASGRTDTPILNESYNVYYIKNRNQLVFSPDLNTNGNIMFMNANTLECCAEVNGMYNNSSAPIAVIGSKYVEFYPYYTDKQLIDRAESIYTQYTK